MPVLINKDTQLAEDLSSDQAMKAAADGTHLVPMMDPNGNPVAVDYKNASDLLNQNYSQPNTDQLGKLLTYAKYSSTGQQAATALESGLSTATFGLSRGLEKAALGNAEEQRMREEVNPGSKMIGDISTLMATSLIPGVGAANILERTGQGAVKLAGLAEKSGIVNAILKGAVKTGSEAALYQSGQEVGKFFEDDPNQSVATAAADIGLSGLFGGALGAPLGLGKGLIEKFLPETKIADSAKEITESATTPPQTSGEEGTQEKIPTPKQAEIAQALSTEDQNIRPQDVQYYQQRSQEMVTDPTTGKTVNAMEASPRLHPNPQNPGERTLHQELEGGLQTVSDDLKNLNTMSRDLLDQADFEVKTSDLSGLLKERIDKLKGEKVVGTAAQDAIKDLEHYYNQLIGSEEKAAPSDFTAKELKKFIKTLDDDLEKVYSTKLSKGTATVGEKELVGLRRDIADSLKNNMTEAGFPEYTQIMADMSRKLKVMDSWDKNFSANNAYNSRILGSLQREVEGIQTTGSLTGKSRQDEANWLKAIADLGKETGQDYQQMFKDRYTWAKFHPDEATTSEKGSMFSQLLKGVNKLQHPVKTILEIPELMQAMKQASARESLTNQPGVFTGVVSAAANVKNFINTVVSGETSMGKAVKSLFTAGTILGASKLSDSEHKKLEKHLDDFQNNPEKVLNMGHGLQALIPTHASAIAMTTANAAQYLNSIKPKPLKLGPLDKEIPPSKADIATYQRQVMIAANPMNILSHIKNGTLTPTDIKTYAVIYPAMVPKLQSKIMDALIDSHAKGVSIPYKTKLGISMFLGQPLDASMSPQSVAAIQASFVAPAPPSQQQSMRIKPNSLSKLPGMAATPQQARMMRMERK